MPYPLTLQQAFVTLPAGWKANVIVLSIFDRYDTDLKAELSDANGLLKAIVQNLTKQSKGKIDFLDLKGKLNRRWYTRHGLHLNEEGNVNLFPVLITTPTRWLYATSEETKVILNCFGRDANPNVSAITLKGEGEIPKHDRCDLIADGYRVPARFIGSSTYSSDFGKIVFPEVDGMYSSEERSLLVHDVNETLKVLQGLDDQLGSLCVKEYSLEGTIQLLRTHYRRRVVIK
ncbi:hypothetical protein J6590_024741 [Homalodisca vitripennis]|nr:hypothetical protein J6590_024741 [Homalodisca vitripennis]